MGNINIIKLIEILFNNIGLWGKVERRFDNTKWIWHKNDADDFPSIPHLHNEDNPTCVMNIYTGEIINKNTNKIISILNNKQFKLLWAEDNFRKHVKYSRDDYYEKKFDDKRYTKLPDCPFNSN